jgi:hypothetical protein
MEVGQGTNWGCSTEEEEEEEEEESALTDITKLN